ncbi:hypothetical protein AOQ84DRAFT_442872 [Glonium stellatum]|uniref:DNA repair protein Rad26 n=1 Tax=Glonium stellatum TaxID=574774 RepID=A0A8E2JN56_9PEZI|nr:hypothetical protein AOQ84DRAFT_442872 [Glonium stellatum]
MADKDDDDEFDFSDHDLGALPENTLRELETTAILSTQRQQTALLSQPTNFQRARPSKGYATTKNAQPHRETRQDRLEPPSSNYSYDDEIVVDLDDESLPAEQVLDSNSNRRGVLSNEPAQWVPNPPTPLQDRYSTKLHSSNLNNYRAGQAYQGRGDHTNAGGEYLYPEEPYVENMEVDTDIPGPGIGISELQIRIQELERERANLLKAVEDAKSAAMSKAGEISIVRRNHEKTTKEYERRIAVMQQIHAEVVAKQKEELEKTKKDRELVETNNLFLEHDLAREAEKAKQLKKSLKDGAGNKPKPAQGSPAVTPKKHKSLPLGDGFGNDDIVTVSPSKVRDKPKISTPKLGAKRKRQIIDQSPVLPLRLSEPRERARQQDLVEAPDLDIDLALLSKLGKEDERFEFIQRLLNHQPSNEHERTLEALTRHAFPSKSDKMLSSVLYDELVNCTFDEDTDGLPLKVCHILMSLWDQCLKEHYYSPLYLLIDALQFILAYDFMTTAVAVTETALPLILASVDLVAIPIARASTNSAFIPDRDTPAQVKLRKEIDVLKCLALLYTIATSCVATPEAISRFWQCMPSDFVLLMLMKAQSLPQIILMLRIFSTSALPNTLGAIVPAEFGPEQQVKRETDTVDRLTNLLFEFPEVRDEPKAKDTAIPSHTPISVCNLRIQVLHVLGALCVHTHGGRSLSRHRHAIGRLVRFLHDQIDALYDYNTLTHSLTVDSINLSMRLLYHLLTNFPDDIDMKAKLNVVQGGSHKHLVALTRLAFSDALVLEEGIEEEVVDAAHQLLDEYLSPEEGEALLQVFSSGRSVG